MLKLVMLINGSISSARLGCCCVVGCPNNSINPLVVADSNENSAWEESDESEDEDDDLELKPNVTSQNPQRMEIESLSEYSIQS